MNHDHHARRVSGKPGLIMLLCYLIPPAALSAILLLGVPVTNTLLFGFILLYLWIHLSLRG
ncbi:MAG: hypothetical protein GTN69_03220 [Armatimonadetes bacterium]|nr:hypothetical protein [Armatimonadota bacterium]